MTAEEFYTQREILIQEQKDNQGKRGYGLTATQKKISELLGFTDDNNTGYWGFPNTVHDCPIDKPFVRQSVIYAMQCPAGLWSPCVDIKYGKTWDAEKSYDWACDSRFSWPPTIAKNILSTSENLTVFDSEEEAYSAAINKAEAWLEAEDKKMTALMEQFAHNELPYVCPLDIYAITNSIEAIAGLIEWLDGVEIEVSGKTPPQDEDGQTRLAGEDVMPTEEGTLSVDKKHAAVAQKYRDATSHLLGAQTALKEIKDDALAPYKGEIDAKKASIELWSFIAGYYQIAEAMEEARIKSEHEDLSFCVYAYALAGTKGVHVAVGTKQDIRDKEFEIISEFTLEIITEYLHGAIVTDEEKTPEAVPEPKEEKTDDEAAAIEAEAEAIADTDIEAPASEPEPIDCPPDEMNASRSDRGLAQ